MRASLADTSSWLRVAVCGVRLTWVNGVSSVLLVHVRTSRCALCDDDGAVVVHEGHLIGCGYSQEFLDAANNRDNAHTRRIVWDAYAENTSGRRL
jgi:hypothetical protein